MSNTQEIILKAIRETKWNLTLLETCVKKENPDIGKIREKKW